MSSVNVKSLEADLKKALEAGNYNAAPSTLVNGSALQREDLSGVMELICHDDSHLKLQKVLGRKSIKSLLVQYDRQLSYGLAFGGTAQFEGQVGQEEDASYARMVVPMAFYSLISNVTIQANMVETVDGIKAEDRVASNAAKKLAADIELDSFRGKGDFSNAGVFDGNPLAIPSLPGMLGLDPQIRMADSMRNAQDLMFAEFGGNESVILSGGSVLSQDNVEDASVRSAMNHGSADKMYLSPKALSLYNKLTFGKERIVLAGSPQGATGGELRNQWTSSGDVRLEGSRFLSAKTNSSAPRSNGPVAPTISTGNTPSTTALAAGTYVYFVTAVNEKGESAPTAAASQAISAGDFVTVTITPAGSGTTRYFNVYRSDVGGTAASAKFIGRVALAAAATTAFIDLGNRKPGHSTAFLVQADTMELKELAPFSSMKLAVTSLALPQAHFNFLCLAVMQPRKNVLVDNVKDF